MSFGAPAVLWLLVLLPALAGLGWLARASRRRRLRRFASDVLLARLLIGRSSGRDAALTALRLGAIALMIVALARPQWGRRDEPVVRRGVDVVLALDLSASMLAEDASPSRFEQARAEAVSLIGSLGGDRVGLVVFGGRAAAPCPLTLDYGAVRLFLDAAEPDFVPGPGSDLGRAIEEASKMFSATERRYKTIVLLTDGEDLEGRGDAAAAAARKDGAVIHTIGVGTEAGAPIPLRDETGALTGYKKDHEGRVVTTRFDPSTLEKIAVQGGGMFLHAAPAGDEGRRIAEAIGGMEKKEIASRLATRFEDRFQIPLAAALALLVLEAAWIGRRRKRAAPRSDRVEAAPPSRRRSVAAALSLTAVALAWGLAAPVPARADQAPGGQDGGDTGASQGWPGDPASEPRRSAKPPARGQDEPPREEKKAPSAAARHNRAANRLYQGKSYDKALSKYEEASAAAPDLPSLRYNIGNALYREGKYDAAAAEYQRALAKAGRSLAPAAHYNLGNARFQQKQYAEAVEAYRKTLEERPGDEAARRNLELALRALQQKPPPQQKPQDSKDQKEQDQKKQDQKNQQQPKPQPGDPDKPEGDPKKGPQGASGPEGRKPQKGGAADGKIGQKEAEKLLDSLAQEEKRDLRKRLARLPQEEGPEKDW